MNDLIVEKNNHIATLTFDRPQVRNALSNDMRTNLRDSLADIEQDDDIRCVVLKGSGEHFMAGGDVKRMLEYVKEPPGKIRSDCMQRIHDLHPIMFTMRRMPKPIIASVEGAAAGAGVSMALASDLVIAADSAFFYTGVYPHRHQPRWIGFV